MELKDVLMKLAEARVSHLRWVAKAEALVEGVPLDRDQVPFLATDCDFGHWYHGEGRALRKLPSYAMLDEPHQKLHFVYMEIFKILYSEEERSSIARFFGLHRKNQSEAQHRAKQLIPQLKEASQAVLHALDRLSEDLEKRVLIHKAKLQDTPDDLEQLAQSLEKMGYTSE